MRGKCQRLRPMKFAPMLFWVTTTYKLLKTVATVDSTSMLRTAAQRITLFAKNTQVWDLQCWCGKVRQRLDASRPGGRHTCMSASVKSLSTSYIDVPAWPLYTTWNNCVKYCLKNDSAALSSLSRSVVKWYCLDARLCSLRWCLPCDVEWQHESYYVNEEPANSSPLQETSMTMRGPQQQPNHINWVISWNQNPLTLIL